MTNQFKVGDYVRRLPEHRDQSDYPYGGMAVLVTGTRDTGTIKIHGGLNEYDVCQWDGFRFELVINNGEAKPPMEYLLQFRGIDDVASVFGYGAKKHGGTFSFRSINKENRIDLLGKAMRHMFKHAQGQKTDPETGKLHLAHAVCDLIMAMDLEKGDN